MFKITLKLVMISMMFMIFACNDEGSGSDETKPIIKDTVMSYIDMPANTPQSTTPTITATGHNLEASHFNWVITAGNDTPKLADIDFYTGVITVINPTTTIGGTITVSATFNNTYSEGTFEGALTINVTIAQGLGEGSKPVITDAKIMYTDMPADTKFATPTITATDHTLNSSHFDWVITAGNDNPKLADIDFYTGVITVTNPTTTIGGKITVSATFNNSYTEGTLANPLTVEVIIATFVIKNANIVYEEIPADTPQSATPTITNTSNHNLNSSHFDWSIDNESLVKISKVTGIITVIDPTTTDGGTITVSATFNDTYTEGTLANPLLTVDVAIKKGNYEKPVITDAKIVYADMPADTLKSATPTITATGHNLEASHFDWSITTDNDTPKLADIDSSTGVITVINPTTTHGGTITISAMFNGTYSEGTLDLPIEEDVIITKGSNALPIPWDGTTTTPITETNNIYEIHKGSDLAWIAKESSENRNDFADKTLKFMDDIDMGNEPFIGIKIFAGKIEGNDKSIYNLKIEKSTENSVGLINETIGTVSIDNLTVASGSIKGASNVGGFIGYVFNGHVTLKNSKNNATVTGTGDSVGGLVGYVKEYGVAINIVNSSNTGNVTGNGSSVGGFVGNSDSSYAILTISNGSNSGDITGTAENIGGLVGYSETVFISNSSNSGIVTGSKRIGGFVGNNLDDGIKISNSSNSGDVIGDVYVGGMIGFVGFLTNKETITIDNSSNSGDVSGTGNNIGGLVGLVNAFKTINISNSYNSGNITGNMWVAGLIGSGMSNSAMNMSNSFNTGNIMGTANLGGLVGSASDTSDITLTNVFSYAETITGTNKVGGLVGSSPKTLAINDSFWLYEATNNIGTINAVGRRNGTITGTPTALTIDTFKAEGNFVDWDFTTIWEMGDKYPLLRALKEVKK